MRKGDEKRQQLLDTAERLFCQKGYEQTSVQDILSEMGLSKGGFYHHFASKEEVMSVLCSRRAERAAAYTAAELNQAGHPLARINAVLRGFMPLRQEEAEFLRLLLPGIGKAEGRAVAMTYQDALAVHFLPLLKAEVASAAAVGAVYPPVKEMEAVILNTVNHCWMEIAAYIHDTAQAGGRIDPLMLLNLMEKYRRAVEVLLDAPYGTVEIIRVEEAEQIAGRLVF